MADEGWAAPGTAGGHGPYGEWAGAPGQRWAGPHAPPPPPQPGGVRLRVVLGVLAIVALVAVTVAVALVLPSGDGNTAEPVEPVDDADLVPFRDPQGAYEISVPQGWVSASLEGDISGVGQEAFPDDPDLAAELQRRLTAVPRATIFVSLDGDQMRNRQLARNITISRLPGAGGGDQDDLAAEARRGIGGVDVTDEGSFMALGREGVRFEYEVSGSAVGVAYFLDAGGDVWALTYTSVDLPEDEPVADAVAETFVPGG